MKNHNLICRLAQTILCRQELKVFFIIFSLSVIILAVFFPNLVLAEESTSFFGFDTSSPQAYTNSIYRYGLVLVAFLSAAGIVYGGVRYLTSAGNQEAVTSGKQAIFAALSGLVLVLLSHLILRTIDPSLVNLRLNIPGVVLPDVADPSRDSFSSLRDSGMNQVEAEEATRRGMRHCGDISMPQSAGRTELENACKEQCHSDSVQFTYNSDSNRWVCYAQGGSLASCDFVNEEGNRLGERGADLRPSAENCARFSGDTARCIYRNNRCESEPTSNYSRRGQLSAGEQCEEEEQCLSGDCDNVTWTSALTPGYSWKYCVPTSGEKIVVGLLCNDDEECLSGRCVDNHCHD